MTGARPPVVEDPVVVPPTATKKPVQIKIKPVVSVEWVSIPGHQYTVESSTDLVNWIKIAEGVVDFEESSLLEYADGRTTFYRVYDLTP
jgi:hypothetical protein